MLQLLVVNYHYFGDYNVKYNGINSLAGNTFESQMKELGNYFEFISQNDLVSAINGNKMLPDMCCMLTFDDGLKSQYEITVPILEKLRLPAVFFICGLPLVENKVLNIHKIHWLRSILDPEKFLEKIIYELENINVVFVEDMVSLDKIADKFFWDDEPTKKLKYLLNVVLPYSKCKKIIDIIFNDHVHSENEFSKIFYMNENEVKYLANKFDVGTHTYSHLVLGKHTNNTIRNEISSGMSALKDITGHNPLAISYPYGYKEAVTRNIPSLASKLGLKYGFTVERSFNTSLNDAFLFARLDTNDAPMGKDPLFNIVNNTIVPRKHLTLDRTRYFNEKSKTSNSSIKKSH